jgi:hypothetical protein
VLQLIPNAAALMKRHEEEDPRRGGMNSCLQDIGLFPLILTYLPRYQITIGFAGPWEPASGQPDAYHAAVSALTPQI